MKALIALLIVVVSTSCSSQPSAGRPDLRVATFNLHYLFAESESPVMQWGPRSGAVVEVLREVDADILAFQEMETFVGGRFNETNRQQETIADAFPGFRFAATGNPRDFPNTQPVMYRANRFSEIDQGFFFFGPEPDTIYSDPWLGRYPAYATWVRLRVLPQNGGHTLTILVMNVHIDRQRYRNQIRSARLLADRIETLRRPGEAVVLAGDFNAFRAMAPVRIVRRRADLSAAPPTGATFHFYRGLRLFPAIDHILYGPGLRATAARVVRSSPGGVWPSDHFPVVADFEFVEPER